MTTPTSPDGDRLPATNSGQKTCGCKPHPVTGDVPCHRCGQYVNRTCWNCHTRRGEGPCSAPQQPTAQERENVDTSLCASNVRDFCVTHQQDRTVCDPGSVPRQPAPPSEADSAGEDERAHAREREAAMLWLYHHTGLNEDDLEHHADDLLRALALAASPGAQGGSAQRAEPLVGCLTGHAEDVADGGPGVPLGAGLAHVVGGHGVDGGADLGEEVEGAGGVGAVLLADDGVDEDAGDVAAGGGVGEGHAGRVSGSPDPCQEDLTFSVQSDDGEARERLTAVLALHPGGAPFCGTCVLPSGSGREPWPCPTVRAVGDGQ